LCIPLTVQLLRSLRLKARCIIWWPRV
jgi:hypothetical protein